MNFFQFLLGSSLLQQRKNALQQQIAARKLEAQMEELMALQRRQAGPPDVTFKRRKPRKVPVARLAVGDRVVLTASARSPLVTAVREGTVHEIYSQRDEDTLPEAFVADVIWDSVGDGQPLYERGLSLDLLDYK